MVCQTAQKTKKSKKATKTLGMSETIMRLDNLFPMFTINPLESHLYPTYLFVSEVSASGGSLGNSVKNKHPEDAEEDMEAEQQEVKRLKFSKDEEEEEDEEDDEEEQEVDTMRPLHAACLSKEAEAMVQEEDEEEKVGYSKESEASSSAAAAEDQGRVFYVPCVTW